MRKQTLVKKVKLLLVFTIPVLLFLNLYQVFSYDQMESEIEQLEKVQKEQFEENKRIIIGIEYLSSPSRIDELASEKLDMKKSDNNKTLYVEFIDDESLKKEDGSNEGGQDE